MDERENLQLEIKVLKERVYALEKAEKRRKIFALIKLVITIAIIIVVAIYAWNVYTKVKDFYDSVMELYENYNQLDLSSLFKF